MVSGDFKKALPSENENKKQQDTQFYMDQEMFKKVMMWEKSVPQEEFKWEEGKKEEVKPVQTVK